MSSNMEVIEADGHRNWIPLQMSSADLKDAPRICTVLDFVLKHLGLEDIKNCRRVCQEWNFVAKSYIPKLAAVHFPIGSPSPDYVMRESAHLGISALTFSSFRYGNDELVQRLPWSLTKLEEFFKSGWGQDVKTLKLKGLTLKHQSGQIIFYFNLERLLKPLIQLSELTVEIPSQYIRRFHNYRMFKIDKPGATTNIIVPLDKLTSLKVIQLKNCDIELPVTENEKDFSKIIPLKISLIDVGFYHKEKLVLNVILNDFVDFSKATEITVIKKTQISPTINLTSEMSHVRKLTLSGCKFDRKIDIPIKQIVFEDATIDLSILPQTIQKIHFKYRARFTNVNPLLSNYFPNLNFVAIDLTGYDKSEVEHGVRSFKSACSNLQSRNIRHIRLKSNLMKRHIGPFLGDEHAQQFPPEETMILYKPSDTKPYKLNAGFGQSLKQGTFSME